MLMIDILGSLCGSPDMERIPRKRIFRNWVLYVENVQRFILGEVEQ